MTSSHFGRRDIISDLPRNIVQSILERMPVRDAARTSILSSKWRYIWTTISQLVLDKQFFEKTFRIKPQRDVTKAVEKILFLHNGPIKKFVLHLPVLPFNGHLDIDHWILKLSWNGIEDFTLHNSNSTRYNMPSCIYSCRDLRNLEIVNCILKPPRELSGFQKVTELHFERITFANNMLRTLLSRSELLVRLVIHCCSGIGHLNIHALNLEVLSISRNYDMESLSFVDTPELWWCSIELGKKMASLTRGKTPSLAEFLVALPRVSDLHLDIFFLELLAAAGGLVTHPTRFTLLDSLTLDATVFNDVGVIACIFLLIQSCPNLTKLTIWCCPATNTFGEEVANYLEAPARMDQTFAKLHSVKIMNLKRLKPQLLLIKLLLACSPILETMFIELSGQLDLKEQFEISKELSLFPRLSPKAAVKY